MEKTLEVSKITETKAREISIKLRRKYEVPKLSYKYVENYSSRIDFLAADIFSKENLTFEKKLMYFESILFTEKERISKIIKKAIQSGEYTKDDIYYINSEFISSLYNVQNYYNTVIRALSIDVDSK